MICPGDKAVEIGVRVNFRLSMTAIDARREVVVVARDNE